MLLLGKRSGLIKQGSGVLGMEGAEGRLVAACTHCPRDSRHPPNSHGPLRGPATLWDEQTQWLWVLLRASCSQKRCMREGGTEAGARGSLLRVGVSTLSFLSASAIVYLQDEAAKAVATLSGFLLVMLHRRN